MRKIKLNICVSVLVSVSVLALVLFLSSCGAVPLVRAERTNAVDAGSAAVTRVTAGSIATAADKEAADPAETDPKPEMKPIRLKTLDQYSAGDLSVFKKHTFYPDLEAFAAIVNREQDIQLIAEEAVQYPDLQIDSPERDQLFAEFYRRYNEENRRLRISNIWENSWFMPMAVSINLEAKHAFRNL